MLFTGCYTAKGYYNVGLKEVERPEDSSKRYGEFEITTLEEGGKTKYAYEDEVIKIYWLPSTTQFNFVLENKSSNSVKVIWDEAAYVDIKGSTQRVMHSGVKYTERNNSQPPTIVLKNAKVDDLILPTENVYYVSGQYGGWRTAPLFPTSAQTKEDLDLAIKSTVGGTVKILLPIQIEDVVNEYIFSFEIKDFVRPKA